MIRLFHVSFPTRTLLLVVSEACLIILALLGATMVWLTNESVRWLNYEHGFLRILVVSFAFLLCMYYYDLYDSIVLGSIRKTLGRLTQALGTVCIILTLVYYGFPEVRIGRGIFLLGVSLVGLLLGAWRNLFVALNRSSYLGERAALLGGGPLALTLAREIEQRPELGVHLLGFLDCSTDMEKRSNGIRRLGHLEELSAVIDRERISRVIVAMSDRRGRLPVSDLLRLKTQGLQVLDGADFYETISGKVSVDLLRASRLVFSPGFCVSRTLLFYKRVASIVLSLLGLIILLPAMALIAVAIWLDSGSPVIFRQQRVGKEGNLFTLLKFRSMRTGVDSNSGFKAATENDERFTRLGRWLRRTRLDELPQLYNILRGDMDFVGPRPFAREEEEKLAEQIPFYSHRWAVKPGATGWAQVHRSYCASVEDNIEKLSYDLFYIKNMSVGLDLLILFQTTKILLLGRGAR